MAPTMDEVFIGWRIQDNVSLPLRDHFSDIWTEEGLCFTYNIINSTELYNAG